MGMILNTRGLLGEGLGKGSSRHASAGFPSAPPGSPLLWYDFSDLTTMWVDDEKSAQVASSGDNIGHIDSKGSDTTAAVQDTADEHPRYTTAAPNMAGVGVAEFDGNDVLDALVTTAAEAPFSYVFVGAVEATGSAEIAFTWPGSSTSGMHVRTTGDPVWQSSHNAVSTFSTTNVVADTWQASINIVDTDIGGAGNDLITYISLDSGSEAATVEAGTLPDNSTELLIGANLNSGGGGIAGNIGEIIIYNSALGASDIQSMKNYIQGKYGITWA